MDTHTVKVVIFARVSLTFFNFYFYFCAKKIDLDRARTFPLEQYNKMMGASIYYQF